MGTATGAAAAARKLIDQDKVSIVVGLSSDAETMAAAPIFQQARIPFLSAFVDSPELAAIGNFIFPVPSGAAGRPRRTSCRSSPSASTWRSRRPTRAAWRTLNHPDKIREALAAQPAPPPFPSR